MIHLDFLLFLSFLSVLLAADLQGKFVMKWDVEITMAPAHFTRMNTQSNAEPFPCSVKIREVTYQGFINVRGAFSRTFGKKSYRVSFNETLGVPKLNLFNYPSSDEQSFRSMVFLASWIDPLFIRNKLTYDIALGLGGYAPRTAYSEVTVNGAYYGFYILAEKMGAKYLERQGWNSKEGNMYAAISWDANWFNFASPLSGYEKKINPTGNSKSIASLLNALNEVYPKNAPSNFTTPTMRIWESKISPLFVTTDWFIYCFVHVFANDIDGFGKNYIIYNDPTKPETTPFRVIHWDSDATWGQSWDGSRVSGSLKLWGTISGADEGMSYRLWKIPEYFQAYLRNFKCLIEKGSLNSTRIIERAAGIISEIKPFINRDIAKWKQSAISVDDHHQYLRNWIIKREKDILGLINKNIVSSVDSKKVVDSWGLQKFECGVIRTKTLPRPPHQIKISEISGSGKKEFIELWNPTHADVNIGGWFLSDSSKGSKHHYTIPHNTIVKSKGYKVFESKDYGKFFKVNSDGENIKLRNNLGQQIHQAKFHGHEKGGSAIYLNIANDTEYYLSREPTPGSQNGYPKTSPVVISEINFHVNVGRDQYIVITALKNTNLYHAKNRSVTWKFTEGIKYQFPHNTTLIAGGKAYVVPISPSIFRKRNSIPSTVPVFGPWNKSLNDEGELVILSVPFLKDDKVDYEPLEMVHYKSKAPWPIPGCLATDQRTKNFSRLCQFPFTEGVVYNSCVPPGKHSRAWCALQVTESGKVREGMWGYCATGSDCKEASSISRLSLTSLGNNPANWARTRDLDSTLRCNTSVTCPVIDSCTWSSCISGKCTFELVGCRAGLTDVQIRQVNQCFPFTVCRNITLAAANTGAEIGETNGVTSVTNAVGETETETDENGISENEGLPHAVVVTLIVLGSICCAFLIILVLFLLTRNNKKLERF